MKGKGMTTSEHRLIVEMLKNQILLYAGLVEILKSRGIVEKGDLDAFDELVSASHREFLEQNVEADYLRNAATLGVITGLAHVDDH